MDEDDFVGGGVVRSRDDAGRDLGLGDDGGLRLMNDGLFACADVHLHDGGGSAVGEDVGHAGIEAEETVVGGVVVVVIEGVIARSGGELPLLRDGGGDQEQGAKETQVDLAEAGEDAGAVTEALILDAHAMQQSEV